MARARFWRRTVVTRFWLMGLLLLAVDGHAESAAAQLAALLEPVQRLSAQFTQTVHGTHQELLQSTEGYLRLQRPQQFKWVLLAPYPQTIVTAGSRLFIYDPDLKQVQVKALADALSGTPALVLLGTAKEIEAQFKVDHKVANDI